MRNLSRAFLIAGFMGLALVGIAGLLAPIFWQGEMINPFRLRYF